MVGQLLSSPFWIMPKHCIEMFEWEMVVHPEMALIRRLLDLISKRYQVPPFRYILAFHLEHTIALCHFDVRSWYLFCKCYLVHGCVNDRFWPIVEITGHLGTVGTVQ